ncbi:DUF2796 domain-containing protein [Vibrio sp. SS-MA-C1-2]|uniref:zinc uptake protein ZrgA n=1 Tax=Vibrio sp. SS-MA-C1-2 TaxID=2908646 RepID=UPI001F21F80F|nr:DUF2796 domain-containing protein [Vibrio sp. SS-MA-C1-2]UJF18617.1 DUF2796 domain-containing protein [Vibrio sp. SS-MA-C1-2]
MKNLHKLTLLSLLTATTAVNAEEFIQHDAHVHGHVELYAIQDNNQLLLEFNSPSADIIGFEHAPKNSDQQTIVNNAVNLLSTPSSIVSLTKKANCEVIGKQVISPFDHDDHADHDEHEHDDHADHDEHGYDDHADHDEHGHDDHADHDEHGYDDHADHDEHGHDDHADHDEHGHDDHTDHDSGHSAFSVQYTYQCDNIDALTEISTQWFTHFTNTKEIKVTYLAGTKQLLKELTPTNSTLSIK